MILLVITAFIIWFVFKLKSKKQVKEIIYSAPTSPELIPVENEIIVIPQEAVDEKPTNMLHQYKNAVLLFGDLQIFDKDGIEITKQFTPVIRELFLVILLYSIRWGRGVSSDKLNEILWFDKDIKSARNNRSVNLVKLKNLLEKLENCQLSKETGYWKLDIDFSCIYVDYYHYLSIIKDKKGLNRKKVTELSEITQRGNFLSRIEYEWLDSFKSEISNEVIDTYFHFVNNKQSISDPEFMVELANFIFFVDPANEEAMILKCRTLVQMGKHTLAKNAFENFVKEYKIIYNEDFKKDFHSIVE